MKIEETDKGRWVEYEPGTAWNQKGILKKYNNAAQLVWVVFNCGGKWKDYKNYTGQACKYTQIKFTDDEKI